MDLREFRISDAELEEYGVSSAPDDLTGTPAAQVKALFDRLPRKLAERLNGALETLSDEDTGPISKEAAEESFLPRSAVTQSLGISPDRVPSELAVTQAIGTAGGGDMMRSVYDSDLDGTVDRSANGLFKLTHSVQGDIHTLTGTVPARGQFTVCFTATRGFFSSHQPVISLNGTVQLTLVFRGTTVPVDGIFKTGDTVVGTVVMEGVNSGTVYIESIPCLYRVGGHMEGSLVIDRYFYETNQEYLEHYNSQVRNVTLSTEEPTGGINGDLWLRYEE